MDKLDMIKTIRNAVDFLDSPGRWNCLISFKDDEAGRVLARLANNLNEVANILSNERREEREKLRRNRPARHLENASPRSPSASPRSPD